MKRFAKFDEIPSMILEVIKETKRYGHTFGRTVVRSDNVKTVYPPTNTVCGGYKQYTHLKVRFAGGIKMSLSVEQKSKSYLLFILTSLDTLFCYTDIDSTNSHY